MRRGKRFLADQFVRRCPIRESRSSTSSHLGRNRRRSAASMGCVRERVDVVDGTDCGNRPERAAGRNPEGRAISRELYLWELRMSRRDDSIGSSTLQSRSFRWRQIRFRQGVLDTFASSDLRGSRQLTSICPKTIFSVHLFARCRQHRSRANSGLWVLHLGYLCGRLSRVGKQASPQWRGISVLTATAAPGDRPSYGHCVAWPAAMGHASSRG